MNKSELVAMIAEKGGFTKKDAERALDSTISSISTALSQGEKVQLVGFGTFEVRERKARTGRNPQTGQEISIAATKTAVFKAGKALKDSVK